MKPLYFLTHAGNPRIFSGYGIPLKDNQKSPLSGMLMIDRPSRCPERYIQELKETFDEVIIGPMTMNGDRGLFTQMRIEDPYSLDLVKNDFSGLNITVNCPPIYFYTTLWVYKYFRQNLLALKSGFLGIQAV